MPGVKQCCEEPNKKRDERQTDVDDDPRYHSTENEHVSNLPEPGRPAQRRREARFLSFRGDVIRSIALVMYLP
jgi:hypothetical protein